MGKLHDLCEEIGWSVNYFSKRTGINSRTARRWDSEENTPPNMLNWLVSIVNLVRAVPPPETKMGRRPAVNPDTGPE